MPVVVRQRLRVEGERVPELFSASSSQPDRMLEGCGRIRKETTMTDTSTRKPIRVSLDAMSGPYIWVTVDHLEPLRQLLQGNNIPHWVDHTPLYP